MTCSHPTRYHEASQGVTVCLLCEIERLQADNKRLARELDNARADHAIIADITMDGDNMDPDEMRREVHKIAALASQGHSGIKEADELRADNARYLARIAELTEMCNLFYQPVRDAARDVASDGEAIADIMIIAANLQQMRELLDKQEGK
jgi:hypothetical protein